MIYEDEPTIHIQEPLYPSYEGFVSVSLLIFTYIIKSTKQHKIGRRCEEKASDEWHGCERCGFGYLVSFATFDTRVLCIAPTEVSVRSHYVFSFFEKKCFPFLSGKQPKVATDSMSTLIYHYACSFLCEFQCWVNFSFFAAPENLKHILNSLNASMCMNRRTMRSINEWKKSHLIFAFASHLHIVRLHIIQRRNKKRI